MTARGVLSRAARGGEQRADERQVDQRAGQQRRAAPSRGEGQRDPARRRWGTPSATSGTSARCSVPRQPVGEQDGQGGGPQRGDDPQRRPAHVVVVGLGAPGRAVARPRGTGPSGSSGSSTTIEREHRRAAPRRRRARARGTPRRRRGAGSVPGTSRLSVTLSLAAAHPDPHRVLVARGRQRVAELAHDREQHVLAHAGRAGGRRAPPRRRAAGARAPRRSAGCRPDVAHRGRVQVADGVAQQRDAAAHARRRRGAAPRGPSTAASSRSWRAASRTCSASPCRSWETRRRSRSSARQRRAEQAPPGRLRPRRTRRQPHAAVGERHAGARGEGHAEDLQRDRGPGVGAARPVLEGQGRGGHGVGGERARRRRPRCAAAPKTNATVAG